MGEQEANSKDELEEIFTITVSAITLIST